MARHLDDNINYEDVTIQNIKGYERLTSQTITEINNVDIENMETRLDQLRNVYDKEMRFISQTEPVQSEKGMLWFIKS